MTRSSMLVVIAGVTAMASLAWADVPGTYRPGQAPSVQPKPTPPATTRPQGTASTYQPRMQPAPQRPTFSAPPQAPSKSYTPTAPR